MDMRLQGNRPGDDVARCFKRSRERGRTGSAPGSAERERGGLDGRSGAGRQLEVFRTPLKGLAVHKKCLRRHMDFSPTLKDNFVSLIGVERDFPGLQATQAVPAVAEVERDA